MEKSLKEFQEKYERETTTKEHEFNLRMKKMISQKEDEIQIEKQKVSGSILFVFFQMNKHHIQKRWWELFTTSL